MAETYAIVESGGKQYRAEKGTTLLVDRLRAEEGAKVNLRALMFRGEKDTVLAANELEKVKVEAVVAEHLRGDKLRVFKYRPKKGYRRRRGHRSELTKLEVTEVRMLTRKPAAKKSATAAKRDDEGGASKASQGEGAKRGEASKAPRRKRSTKADKGSS